MHRRRPFRRQVLVIQPAHHRPQALGREHGDAGDDETEQKLAVVAQCDEVLVEADAKIVVEMPPL